MGTMDTGSAPAATWGSYVDHILCDVCGGGEHEDKILLCDLCDKGFHMYCLREPLEAIPQGTWLCDSCAGIACHTCGLSNDSSLLLICDRCDSAYHTYCTVPPVLEVPPGGWRCPPCATDPYIATACQICKQGTDDEHMLLCDGCDKGHHLHCLDPPLLAVPEGDWFCPACVRIRPRNRRRREQVAAALAHGGTEAVSKAIPRDASGGKYPPGVTEEMWKDLSIIRRIGLMVDVHTGALASARYVPLLIEIMSDAVWKLQETCASVLLCTCDADTLQTMADEGSACVLGILSLAMSEFSEKDTWSAFKVVTYMTRLLLHLPMALHHYQSPTVKLLLGGAFMPAISAQQRINDARPELFTYINQICTMLRERTGSSDLSGVPMQRATPATLRAMQQTSAPPPAKRAKTSAASAPAKGAGAGTGSGTTPPGARGRRVSSRAAVAAINSNMAMANVAAVPAVHVRRQPSALEPVCVGKCIPPLARGAAPRVPFRGHRIIMVSYRPQRATTLAKRLRGKGLSVSVRDGRSPLSFGDIQDNTHVVIDFRGRHKLPAHTLAAIDPARYHLDCLIFADTGNLLDHFAKGGVSRFLDETSEPFRMLRGGGYVIADVAHMSDPVRTLRHMKAVADWHSDKVQTWHILVSPGSLLRLARTHPERHAEVAALRGVAFEEADGALLLERDFTEEDAEPQALLHTAGACVREYQRDARFFAVVSDNKVLHKLSEPLVDVVAVDFMPRYWNEHGADINAVAFESIAEAIGALDGDSNNKTATTTATSSTATATTATTTTATTTTTTAEGSGTAVPAVESVASAESGTESGTTGTESDATVPSAEEASAVPSAEASAASDAFVPTDSDTDTDTDTDE